MADQLPNTNNPTASRATFSEQPSCEKDFANHRTSHANEAFHHYHSHAEDSRHEHGHHLLQIEGFSIGFSRYEQAGLLSSKRVVSQVIEGLNLSVHVGEIVAIVGASGSGKSLLASAIMGLYEHNALVTGTIYYDGKLQTAQSLRALRAKEIALVPQSVSALDPLMKVGKQIGGTHQRRRELFVRYHLDESVADLYPHQLSGGMARRVLLATALVNRPHLIVADEPTPGLDLELAVQAMDDFRAFANEGGAVLLITHDIELALRVADRIAVFNAGRIVEETAVENFASPDLLAHEFSRALWHALPEHDFQAAAVSAEETCNAHASTERTNVSAGTLSELPTAHAPITSTPQKSHRKAVK